jgi:N-acyl-D-aspartate/D-glutamate deacylase
VALEDDMKALFVTSPRPLDMGAMKEMANSPFALPGVSDGGAHTKFITLGRYPTEYLSLLVRDNNVMDLEQAHWRLSAYPALAAGIKDRGWIREGAPADLVIYDLDALGVGEIEKAWDYPAGAWRLVRKPEGYRHIMVNGEVTFRDNECTGSTPGRLLRHGSAGNEPA